MPLRTPTLRQVLGRVRSDIVSFLPTLDPTVPGSLIGAIAESFGARVAALYNFVDQASEQSFPQTATDANLDRWAGYEGLSRNAASGSTGAVVVTGNIGVTLPVGASVNSSSGLLYTTDQALTLSTQISSISSLSRSGNLATAVSTGHLVTSGQTVSISGAVDVEYNGDFVVTVVDVNTFTYQVPGAPNTPTSGTILAAYDGGTVDVSSDGVGVETNLEAGGRMSLGSPVTGIDNTVLVGSGGLTGGAEDESDDLLRARILLSRSSVRSNFSPDEIENLARSVPGVSRVLVVRARPSAGSTTVLFVRDGDANIIPSAADVANVRTALLANLPATTQEAGLIVAAPIPVVTNFAFTSVVPNTQTMKNAVAASLAAFFEDNAQIEQSLTEDQYRSAIIQTVDSEASSIIQSFTLSTPIADITVAQGEIAVLGTVTFS